MGRIMPSWFDDIAATYKCRTRWDIWARKVRALARLYRPLGDNLSIMHQIQKHLDFRNLNPHTVTAGRSLRGLVQLEFRITLPYGQFMGGNWSGASRSVYWTEGGDPKVRVTDGEIIMNLLPGANNYCTFCYTRDKASVVRDLLGILDHLDLVYGVFFEPTLEDEFFGRAK